MPTDSEFPRFLKEAAEKLRKEGLDKISPPDDLVKTTVDYCKPELDKLSENLEEKVTLRDRLLFGACLGIVASVYLTYKAVQEIKHAYYHLRGIEHFLMDTGDWMSFPYYVNQYYLKKEVEERKSNLSNQTPAAPPA